MTAGPGFAPPAAGRPGGATSRDAGSGAGRSGPVPGTSPVRTLLLVGGALLLGVLAGLLPLGALVLVLGALLVWAVMVRPAVATYAYLGVAPLVVGLGRGGILPGIRANELLIVLAWVGLLLAPVRRWYLSGERMPRWHPLDWLMLALAVASSFTTALWMIARGEEVTGADVLYGFTLWKLLALYVLVRITVRTATQAWTAAAITMSVGAVVGLIGILQAVDVESVVNLLNVITPAESGKLLTPNRASSLIGTPIGYADYMVLCLGLAIGGLLSGQFHRTPDGQPSDRRLLPTVLLSLAVPFFAVATLASGQISGTIAVIIALVVTVFLTRRWLLVLGSAVGIGLAAVPFLGAVISARLAALDLATGLPASWTGPYGRISNLTTYFLPNIAEDWAWVFGVRMNARVSGASAGRPFVYIESGYVYLLWSGGVLLLLVFLAFALVFFVLARRARRRPEPGWSQIGAASVTGIVIVVLLMAIDPHLTIRGCADLLFPLAAMTVTAATLAPPANPSGGETPAMVGAERAASAPSSPDLEETR